jgi:hypothetical protein
MSVIDNSWRKTNKDSSPNISGWRTGGHKRSINNSWPYSELTHAADPKSKSGSRSLEMASYPVRMLHAPSGRPWPWGRNLRHFLKSILFPVPEYLSRTSWQAHIRFRKLFRESWNWKLSRRWLPHFLSQPRKLLMLKHRQRCYEFDTNRKRTTW